MPTPRNDGSGASPGRRRFQPLKLAISWGTPLWALRPHMAIHQVLLQIVRPGIDTTAGARHGIELHADQARLVRALKRPLATKAQRFAQFLACHTAKRTLPDCSDDSGHRTRLAASWRTT